MIEHSSDLSHSPDLSGSAVSLFGKNSPVAPPCKNHLGKVCRKSLLEISDFHPPKPCMLMPPDKARPQGSLYDFRFEVHHKEKVPLETFECFFKQPLDTLGVVATFTEEGVFASDYVCVDRGVMQSLRKLIKPSTCDELSSFRIDRFQGKSVSE